MKTVTIVKLLVVYQYFMIIKICTSTTMNKEEKVY